MKNFAKNNLPLIVGIALPLIFIIILALVLLLPPLFLHPQYNFIYTINPEYPYGTFYENKYAVTNGQLAVQAVTPPANLQNEAMAPAPTLYLYNVKTDATEQITLQEAQSYTLDPGPTSPDGYNFGYQNGNDNYFFLFGGGGSNNSGYYLSKGNAAKRLVISSGDYYNNGLTFIAWVK